MNSTRRRDVGAPRRKAKSRAAPPPVRSEPCQTGFDGILFDVGHHVSEMFGIAYVAVEILAMPKLTLSAQELVRLVTGEGFPRMQNFIERESFQCLDQRMNMIEMTHHASKR